MPRLKSPFAIAEVAPTLAAAKPQTSTNLESLFEIVIVITFCWVVLCCRFRLMG